MPHPLALVCSVALEAAPLRRALEAPRDATVGRKAAVRGRLGGRPVVMLQGGMGKSNAAQALTALLETEPVAGVIGFGVGGAYAGAGVGVGALALATAEVYGDEGVEAPQGWISTEGIGIPLLQRGSDPVYNRFPLDPERVGAAQRLLEGDAPLAVGPFVTVSACSGTARRGAVLAERFGAVCESMEGAAYAHISALYEVPFLEIRGISNLVEDRDLARWRLADAAAAAARGVERVVQGWGNGHS